ncbi:polysaccharide deacetylase family protein [Candidatus Albibeggiatoa sp. nov. BB20]|uniref:polysaccharide deacetylase family protein n=1 Tax=Candidatus Albibeggiatoa sp. nov. BB20 TaxID=3162723 RepID=UPI003365825C
MKKLLILRFDIDTHICMAQGVPALLTLAEQMQVKFNFFVNMGRAVSHVQTLKEMWQKKNASSPITAKLSNTQRLGKKGYIKVAASNPPVGINYPKILQRVIKEKHHLGLHGGRNHALWQRKAHTWNIEKLRNEIEWGIKQLRVAGIENINSFASPGWNGSQYLPQILMENGFQILADQHDIDLHKIEKIQDTSLLTVPTNLLGEPGGVGYIEYLRVRYKTDETMLNVFSQDLQKHPHLAVLYDHPVYAGMQELEFVRKLIMLAQEQSFEIVNFDTACQGVERV